MLAVQWSAITMTTARRYYHGSGLAHRHNIWEMLMVVNRCYQMNGPNPHHRIQKRMVMARHCCHTSGLNHRHYCHMSELYPRHSTLGGLALGRSTDGEGRYLSLRQTLVLPIPQT